MAVSLSLSEIRIRSERAALEWPTVVLILTIYVSWLGLVFGHAALPLWLWLPLAGWTGAWWGSAQHELLHGHPTRHRRLNDLLATPPVWLWLPYARYRQTHLVHHNDDRLTDPLDDPESRYLTAESWRALGPVGQALVGAQATLLGRLVLGPPWAAWQLWRDDLRAIRAGDRRIARVWAWHLVHVAGLLGVAIGVAGVPFWQYLLGFCYLATSLALIRSFAEHKAAHGVAERTAIVEGSPLLALLFLNNNLHVVHHQWPSLPWYCLPKVYRQHRHAVLAHNGGLVYRGYGEIFRRFLLRRHDQPVHPLGRAPRPAPSAAPASGERLPATPA